MFFMARRRVNSSLFSIHPLAAAVAASLRRTVRNVAPATGLACILAAPGFANAATFQVTNINDAGPGSLRQAVLDTNGNPGADEIVFDASVSGTLNLTSGPLELVDSVAVTGPGSGVLSIDAGGSSDIFVISNSSVNLEPDLHFAGLTLSHATRAISASLYMVRPAVTIDDCILSGNVESAIFMYGYNGDISVNASNSELSGNGGHGILIQSTRYARPSEVVVEDVIISGNQGYGVAGFNLDITAVRSEIRSNAIGLFSRGQWDTVNNDLDVKDSVIVDNEGNGVSHIGWGSLNLENSTITGNGKAGVLLASLNSSVSISSSTITGNGAHGVNCSDLRDRSELNISNSIIAGNGVDMGSDLSSCDTLYSLHHSLVQNPGAADIVDTPSGSNIVGVDPLLGPLQDNGGSTLTHALLDGSPAIDQGDNATCPDTDQRGIARPQDGNADGLSTCDMGAYEREAATGPNNGSGVIGDFVWRDDDGDGVQDVGEPGLGGVVVNLRVNCDAAVLLTTVTDSSGAFRFEGLPDQNYQLEFVKPAGYTFSPLIAAGDYRIDSNADPATGLDQCRSLGVGRKRLALDAGLVPEIAANGSGFIGDFVWRDENGDGKQDSGEPGLPGVTVNVRVGCDPSTVISTTTDSNGAYRFDDLPAGEYQLAFVKPAGYTFSPKIAAGDYTRDSNADPITGLDQCRSLDEGQSRPGLDSGLVP
ncbi:hypothetical protein FT643_18900 [Ketobacter sp. MCCC 1A13808]|nr:hypothetical protein [Ketobacter sp. MCCC 1A13808]